jgi:hypothetical protein
MRKFFVTTFVLAAMLCLATSSMALEKRAHSFDDNRSDDWNAGATCRVNYYNICTGWVWCWSGFGDNFRLGLVVNSCCGAGESAALLQSQHFLCSPAPPSYGFTGTIAVHSVDANDCPVGAPIASQPYLPNYIVFPFSVVNWGGVPVPNKFAIVVTTAEDLGISSPAQFGTDHPAAGPTGPVSCGTCFPSNRPNHSFGYGTAASPVCPGSTFNDGICNAQLFWDIDLVCAVSVEESSWGSIKGLYR